MVHGIILQQMEPKSHFLAAVIAMSTITLALLCWPPNVNAGDWQKDAITGCAVWTEEAAPDEVVSWSGECREGKADGPGVLVVFKDGQVLVRYAGPMIAGLATGVGTVQYLEGSGYLHYQGEIKDYTLEGYGKMTYPDGGVYEGQFKQNKAEGFGIYTAADGSVYQGQIKMGASHGNGYEKTAEGEIYDGDFVDGKRQGEGILLFTNGDRYVGGFAAGLPEGIGSMYLANGGVFQGHFKGGQPEGIGTYKAPGGKIFQGRFAGGEADGILLVTKPDGTQEQQEWQAGKKLK